MRQSLGRICKQQASKRTAVSRPVDAKLSIQRPDLASKLASVGLSLCLLSGNVESCYAASMNTLADVMRPTYEFVDSNKNGVITLDEIKQLSSEVSQTEGFAQPTETQLQFTMRLFDLNQDGTLTTDEMLTSLALDSVVSEDAVDEDAYNIFDKNGDGFVDRADWRAPFGDIGGDRGEEVKNYVFNRVDHLNDGDNKLNVTELGNGITLMRTLVLGY